MAEAIVQTRSASAQESAESRIERWSFNTTLGFLGGAAAVLLVAPTIVVLITSFTNGYTLKFPPPGYSARWYLALWTDSPEIVGAAVLSLEVAICATAISVLLAVPAALVLSRRRAAWARI